MIPRKVVLLCSMRLLSISILFCVLIDEVQSVVAVHEYLGESKAIHYRTEDHCGWCSGCPEFRFASDEPKFRTARAPAALVLSPIVDGFRLTKVLMDGGIGLNLIYEETLQKMEIDWSRIEQSSTTFRGIIPSQKHAVLGKSH